MCNNGFYIKYFGHLMQRANSLEKTLMLGKIEGKRRSGQQKIRWLDGVPLFILMAMSAVLLTIFTAPVVLLYLTVHTVC